MALVQKGLLRCNDRGRCPQSSLRHLRSVVRTTTLTWLGEGQRLLLQFLIELLRTGQWIRIHERCFCLTAAAGPWLTQSPTQQLERLRCIWWSVPELAAYKPARSRAHDDRSSYWRAMTVEICRWLGALSAQEWTRAAGVRAFLRQRGMVARRGRSDNLPQVRSALQRRTALFIGFLLHSVLPSLGLVESRGAGPDLALRVTPEGGLWLQAALTSLPAWEPPQVLAGPPLVGSASPAEVPTRLVAAAAAWQSQPSAPLLVITDDWVATVRLNAPAAFTFDLAHLGQALPLDPSWLAAGIAGRYRLTRDSLEQAYRWGYQVGDAAFLLACGTQGHLPPSMAERLEAWQEELRVIHAEPGYALRTAAPPLRQGLLRRPGFRRHTQPLLDGSDWVAQTASSRVFGYLRRLGFTVEGGTSAGRRIGRPAETETGPRILWPSLYHCLPVAQLLLALRAYQQLARFIPQLMGLDASSLEAALQAALSPQERAAVQHVTASQAALLEHCLRQTVTEQREVGAIEPAPTRADRTRLLPLEALRADGPSALAERLQRAMQSGVLVELTYVDRQARVSQRCVQPLRFEQRGGQVYLVAYCTLRGAERSFRLDRVLAIGDPAPSVESAQADDGSQPANP